MTHDGAARVQLENDLRLALARRELEVHYQPQVVIADHRITGVEALLRWRHRYRGLVSPAEFIPVAEDSSLIHPLGEYALARASRQIKEWDRAGLPPVRLAFNVSRRQFLSAGFARAIEGALRLAGLDPDRVELELPEGAIVESPDQALAVLKRLKDLGLHIAIDDFGVNHSDPGYLSQMPIDTVKIDGSFVRKVTGAGPEAGIAQAIIVIARARGLRVVAEGVETVAQLTFVASHGCHEAQGDLFCRPIPADEVAKLLASGTVPGPPVAS